VVSSLLLLALVVASKSLWPGPLRLLANEPGLTPPPVLFLSFNVLVSAFSGVLGLLLLQLLKLLVPLQVRKNSY
jgi:hypothetical protein